LRIGDVFGPAGGPEHHQTARGEIIPVQPDIFPYYSLDPVAFHGFVESSGQMYREFRLVGHAVFRHREGYISGFKPLAVVFQDIQLSPGFYPHGSGKTVFSHPIRKTSMAQTPPALCSSPFDNYPSRFGGHPLAKTVISLTLDI
jgi:hypothetical protein